MTFKENVMKNEQKKEYIVPKMEIVMMEHQMDLLDCSTDTDCEPPFEDTPRVLKILEDD